MSTWSRVSVRVPAAFTEVVEDCLLGCGAVSVTLLAGDAQELFAEHGGDAPLWALCAVEGLFADGHFNDGEAWVEMIGALKAQCPQSEVVPIETLTDQDWETQYRQFAVDEIFAGKLRLAPRDASPSGDSVRLLRLDPGMAFGTGSHPTTRLCLEWMAARSFAGQRVLDFGCGSGVLAIAMALLGAAHVDAVDIDRQAVVATRENAAFNGIDANVLEVCETASFTPAGAGYDIVVANILLNPLLSLAPLLTKCLAAGGLLVLSGVLATQRETLFSAYPQIRFVEPVIEDGWVLAEGRRVG
ncbi:MAG: 50S ribosomal protein L11 methyltransferase [Gammaproteobacteria bacterium]|nr:50S ribosomal protein L11 methyltransferase [Gammaproteobacteria bacterium]